uniref:Protein Mis18-beta isoform X2 n=1 Tax=Pogona vitticeps TaxID=103695 RepID=A0A6J0TQN5_9SAUR
MFGGKNKMAVRRQLRLLFQEPQVRGAITVERTELGTGEYPRPQQRMKTPEDARKWVPGLRGLRLEDCAVYQCRRCRAVLGDSLHLCAQEGTLRLLVCFKVTDDVVVEDNLMVCVEGDLIGCTYNMLNCRSCGTGVGFKLYCSKSLAYLRGLFCLFKDSIICYLLKTKTTVEASKVICPPVSLKDHVQQLKENLVLLHKRIELLIKKLEDLNQQTALVENPGYKPRPHGHGAGSTRKKSKQLTG